MSRKVNINLLTASVVEHTHQLRYHLRYPITRFFQNLYDEQTDPVEFGAKLALVADWNQRTIDDVLGMVIKCIKNTHFKIRLAIKAIITARTMLLVAIGNANAEVADTVRIDIPDPSYFMHTVMSFVADELMVYPTLLASSETMFDGRQRKHFLNSIINDAIECTIIDQLSSAAVTGYLDNALDIDRLDRDDTEEDYDQDDQTSVSSAPVDITFPSIESLSQPHNIPVTTPTLESTFIPDTIDSTFSVPDPVHTPDINTHVAMPTAVVSLSQ